MGKKLINPLLEVVNKQRDMINPYMFGGSNIPRNGLIAEWLFDGNANDSSGNGNNLTVSGATLYTGRKGASNSAYRSTSTANSLSKTISYASFKTFSFWFYDESSSGNVKIASVFRSIYKYYSTQNRFLLNMGVSNYRYFDNTNIRGEWQHFVVLIAGTDINDIDNSKLYINGSLVANYITLKTSSADSTNFTALTGYIGIIDDVRIYDRLLSSDEIIALYNE